MIDPKNPAEIEAAAEAAKAALEEEKKQQSGSIAGDIADIAGNVMVDGVGEMIGAAANAVVSGAGSLASGAVEVVGSILDGRHRLGGLSCPCFRKDIG